MSRRDASLAAAIAAFARREAGARDPLAGIPPELEQAFLYSGDPSGRSFGPATEHHILVRRDGYHTSHAGACAVEPTEPLRERLVRQAGLDRDEADILRRIFADPTEGMDTRAAGMGLSLRTLQRREASIRQKLEQLQVDLDRARWED